MYDTSPVITRGSPKNTRRERKFSVLYRRAEAAVRMLYLMHCCLAQHQLVDCGTYYKVLCLLQHFGGVNALALSPDGEQLFTGSRDTSIKGCGSCIWYLRGPNQAMRQS